MKKQTLAKKLEKLVTSHNQEMIKNKILKVETIERDNGTLEVRTVTIGDEEHPTEPNKYTFDFNEMTMKSTITETETGRTPTDEEFKKWNSEFIVVPKETIKRWDVSTWFYVGHHEEEDKFPYISIEGTTADSLINEFYSRNFENAFDELISELNYEHETHVTFKRYA